MKTLTYQDAKKDLDFLPRKKHSTTLPFYSWNHFLLNGFLAPQTPDLENESELANAAKTLAAQTLTAPHASKTMLGHMPSLDFSLQHPVIELANGESANEMPRLAQVIFELYGKLTLSELARLWSKSHGVFGADWRTHLFEHLLTLQEMRLSETLCETFEALAATPLSFQNWVSEKGLGARELSVLKTSDLIQVAKILEKIVELSFSKSQGAQVLEMALELHQQGHSSESLLSLATHGDFWMKSLERLYRPMTSARDEKFGSVVQQLPWPQYLQARAQRDGDRLQIEVKLNFSSLDEMKKRTEGLLRMREHLEANPNLWSKSGRQN